MSMTSHSRTVFPEHSRAESSAVELSVRRTPASSDRTTLRLNLATTTAAAALSLGTIRVQASNPATTMVPELNRVTMPAEDQVVNRRAAVDATEAATTGCCIPEALTISRADILAGRLSAPAISLFSQG